MDVSRFQFQHLSYQKEYQHTPHFHDVNEILFSTNDDATFLLSRNVYQLHGGSLIFITSGALHQKYNATQDMIDSYVLHYDPLLLRELSTSSSNLYAAFAEANCCLHLDQAAFQSIYPLFLKFLSADSGFGSDIFLSRCLPRFCCSHILCFDSQRMTALCTTATTHSWLLFWITLTVI